MPRSPAERTVNFGNLAPWLDVIFGTHHHDHTLPTIGLVDPAPRRYLALLLWPFRRRALTVPVSPRADGAA